MIASVTPVADDALRIMEREAQQLSRSAIEHVLRDSDLVHDAYCLLLDETHPHHPVIVVPSAQGWALVDAERRHAFTQTLGDLLAARTAINLRPEQWRLIWALPQGVPSRNRDVAARRLFDPRRPYVRLLDRQGDCLTLAVEMDPASPYFEGHFDRAAVLAGVVQVEWAVRFGREVFGIGDDFRAMRALKFQKVVRPDDALKLMLDWDRARAMLTFGFSSQAGRHSSGRILFGAPT